MNAIVRAFALSLVVMGAAATTYTSTHSNKVTAARASAMPVPTCNPDGVNTCGMGK